MAVDFKTFGKMVKHVTAVRKPVLLRGRHGIGKSTVVYQYATHIGMPVVERRASQMTEGDLVGLPSIEDNSTRFNPPDWFKTACDMPCVLFLDEVDRATLEVRQGIFELTDSRKLNGHHLHHDTIVFAAVNGGEHGSQYQVGEMDPAELDRWTVFDIEPTVEDWLDWAKKSDISDEVWDSSTTIMITLSIRMTLNQTKSIPHDGHGNVLMSVCRKVSCSRTTTHCITLLLRLLVSRQRWHSETLLRRWTDR